MLIRWLTMGVKWDGADQVSNIMKNTEIIKSVVPNNAMNEARNSRTVQYCSSLPPKLLSRGRSRSTSRQNRCHVEASKEKSSRSSPAKIDVSCTCNLSIPPDRQILKQIEIDSSNWREEIQNRKIQNRNRLLDLAGRNSK